MIFLFVPEHGTFRGTALLHWDEEFNAKKAPQEEGPEDKDNLDMTVQARSRGYLADDPGVNSRNVESHLVVALDIMFQGNFLAGNLC